MLTRLLLSSTCALALSHAALAADVSVTPPPPAPAFSWAGVYIGGQIGYAWATDNGYLSNWYTPGTGFGPSFYGSTATSPDGVIGGAHIGHNWQINQFVLGLEGEVDGSNASKSTQAVPYVYSTTALPLQGALLGRAGYAFDRTLIYATVGGVFAWINNSYNAFGTSAKFSTTSTGWTAGGGVEYAIDDHWSVRGAIALPNSTFSPMGRSSIQMSIRLTDGRKIRSKSASAINSSRRRPRPSSPKIEPRQFPRGLFQTQSRDRFDSHRIGLGFLDSSRAKPIPHALRRSPSGGCADDCGADLERRALAGAERGVISRPHALGMEDISGLGAHSWAVAIDFPSAFVPREKSRGFNAPDQAPSNIGNLPYS